LNNSIHFISLFSGAGGLDLGFEFEGFQPIVAYDKDKSAIETYNYNRSKTIAKAVDLLRYNGEQIIQDIEVHKLAHTPRGVIGGPPCQYYSNGNKSPRQNDDPRRLLPVKYAEILHLLNSKYSLDFFLFENVKGLVGPTHKEDFCKLIELFENAGFHVYFAVLDAYNYSVAQYRKRVFLIGWNNGLYRQDAYKFPIGKPSKKNVREVIGKLPEPQFYERNLDPKYFPKHPNHWTMQPRSPKFYTPPPKGLRKSTRSFRRLSWDEPSYTVAYGHNEIHIHPNGKRRLSIYEAMLLQGFPEGKNGYELLGTLTSQVTLVSDAVPPPLAQAIARSVKEKLIKRKISD
jgi:DNA (cytosine-5)-methyltransferase 1